MLISNFWHVFAAVLPALVILFYVYKQDQFPEPKNIVFKTFIFGCSIVIFLNLILYDVDNFAEKYFKGETFNFFDSFIRAAFLEEISKMAILVFFCTRKDEFDEPMDGLVYGVAASLGFAAYENINYVLYTLKEPSFEIATIRAYTAVPMHALCGVMMGFLITQSIFEKEHNYLNLVLALLIPVGIHGLYNFSLISSLISHEIAYIILVVFLIRAWFLFKNLKKKQNQSIMFNKKYFTITLSHFINASTTVLLIMLGLNYLINITL
jgi:RsiW-degrading membrane proteinase PrsW (M82 family)